ncbi:MAG: acyl-CoA dehydrogenase family protein [Bacteroidota bacterium]
MYADIKLPREIYASEEHQMLKETIGDYFKQFIEPNREKWEEQGYCDKDAWLKAGELGLLCLDMPEEYGGGGLDFTFAALLIEEFSRLGANAPGFSMHSDIIAPYILKLGTEEQKRKYLPKMASGEWVGCLGMTEPGTGSDVQAIRTNAVDMGDHYLINGSKTFITIGYNAYFCIVACKTNHGTPNEGISLIIVEEGMEGFSKGKPFKKLGLKESDTCELFFEDVKVPKENLLGIEGKGFIHMMTELPRERHTIGLQSVGSAEGAIEDTIVYTQTREAFKQPICGFQNTQFKMAEMAMDLQMHQAYIDRCTQLLAEHKLTAIQASMSKSSASDMQGRIVDGCLQLHGGYGFMWEFAIARRFADARVARIYGGTNEIMKLMISRGLFKDYHAELKAKQKAAREKVKV